MAGRKAAHADSFHAVQFYSDDRSLTTTVANFLGEGFGREQPAVVVATAEHISGIERALTSRGLDVKRMKQFGELVVLDAHDTLETFLVGGTPHAEVFKHVIGKSLAEIARIRPDRAVRAFGEMVNVLWQDGLSGAAMQLETLWNELAKSHRFQLMCAYSTRNGYRDAALGEITRHHTHLIDDDGQRATIN